MPERSSKYIPATPGEIRHMLDVVGYPDIEHLLADLVPAEQRLGRPLELPGPMSEPEIVALGGALAGANRPAAAGACFLGAGAYRHHIPVAIHHLAGRGEFLTAYTPYQPEISQGTLQGIFEFQTMVCELFGMEVANASVYDGASALAEALFMAHRVGRGKRPRAILAGAIHPEHLEVCCTYGQARIVALDALAPGDDGRVSIEALEARLGPDVCCVAVQSPNFLGLIEDLPALAARAHAAGALLVVSVSDPHASALFQPPGAQGADIVVAEGQPLGLPLNMGGPYLGLFATRESLVRQMPGRLVGQTTDAGGRPGYVLTLATREQHIRREKATSNICTNQGLCAMQAAMYMSILGPAGLREVAERSHAHALYLARAIAALPGFGVPHGGPFFHEFVVSTPVPAAEIVEALVPTGVFPGLPLSRYFPGRTHELLVCATEANTRAELDELVRLLGGFSPRAGGAA
ncbi:MAG: aminomethyl-transferring glycine dehydrogenase subunit GcvPA [Pseudomonadota bacterium]